MYLLPRANTTNHHTLATCTVESVACEIPRCSCKKNCTCFDQFLVCVLATTLMWQTNIHLTFDLRVSSLFPLFLFGQ